MLSRLSAEIAAEIRAQDWQDAPWRADGARHQRDAERSSKQSSQVLTKDEVETLRLNVMWVAAQGLIKAEPALDLHEFAKACGVPDRHLYNKDGSPSRAITYGVRRDADDLAHTA